MTISDTELKECVAEEAAIGKDVKSKRSYVENSDQQASGISNLRDNSPAANNKSWRGGGV